MQTHTPVLPAEWAPQSAVMLTWPHAHSDWLPWLPQVTPVFTDIAYHVSQRQQLVISCWDQRHQAEVEMHLRERGADLDKIRFYLVSSNDTWARDHGPITVLVNGQPKLLDFIFNGWGKKFEAGLDTQISGKLSALKAFGDTPIRPINLVLEGGSIESDGIGTLLTTEQCLLTPTRNPQLDRAAIEHTLTELLGVDRYLWLTEGHLAGDDTDSHIDTLARFCSTDTIAYVTCEDEDDDHYAPLKAMEAELQTFRTRDGQPYKLVALPIPLPIIDEDGVRLPATHANFLIINGAVLVPTYQDPTDAIALERLQHCFPDREIIAVDCRPLIYQYGSLHCVTMQLPAGVVS